MSSREAGALTAVEQLLRTALKAEGEQLAPPRRIWPQIADRLGEKRGPGLLDRIGAWLGGWVAVPVGARVWATRAAVALGVLALIALAVVLINPQEDTEPEVANPPTVVVPSPVPVTAVPIATATAESTATVTAAATLDPELAAFLAAIDAGDPGPFPKGTFLWFPLPEQRMMLAFGNDGEMITTAGTSQQRFRYTSNEGILVVAGPAPGLLCDAVLDTYGWSFDGKRLELTELGTDNCAELSRFLRDGAWEQPGAVPTATATPDPQMAAFLAAIEAGDPGPFPKGTFVGGKDPAEELGVGAVFTFSNTGELNMNNAIRKRYTSNEEVLVIYATDDPECDSTPDIYGWSFDGTELVFTDLGTDDCEIDSKILRQGPWYRPGTAPAAMPIPPAAATPTPIVIPEAEMARYMDAIEAGDPGSFPSGPYIIRASAGEQSWLYNFGADGRLHLGRPNNAQDQRYTSTDELLIVADEDGSCEGAAAVYRWTLSGNRLVFTLAGEEPCGLRYGTLAVTSNQPWQDGSIGLLRTGQ